MQNDQSLWYGSTTCCDIKEKAKISMSPSPYFPFAGDKNTSQNGRRKQQHKPVLVELLSRSQLGKKIIITFKLCVFLYVGVIILDIALSSNLKAFCIHNELMPIK